MIIRDGTDSQLGDLVKQTVIKSLSEMGCKIFCKGKPIIGGIDHSEMSVGSSPSIAEKRDEN